MAKTNAENYKKYFNRKKAANVAKDQAGMSVVQIMKTSVERNRANRLRKMNTEGNNGKKKWQVANSGHCPSLANSYVKRHERLLRSRPRLHRISAGNNGNVNVDSHEMNSGDSYELKWHSYSSHLNGSVASLFNSQRFTDVVLCTIDGCQIPAHKFILSTCSVYLSSLLENQHSQTPMGGILYVILPSDISTVALKILVEYMYKGETIVSYEVLDTVLKAGRVLKIHGLWRQEDEDATVKITTALDSATNVNKLTTVVNKPVKTQTFKTKAQNKNYNVIKALYPVQQKDTVTRPMFIEAHKLVFVKKNENGTNTVLQPDTLKEQINLVVPTSQVKTATIPVESTITSPIKASPPHDLRKHFDSEDNQENTLKVSEIPSKSTVDVTSEVEVKSECDAHSIEVDATFMADKSHAFVTRIKYEPPDETDIEEESLMCRFLSCELCAKVYTEPTTWVRHVQTHASEYQRKRKRCTTDNTKETKALVRCDLCQENFHNSTEWINHIRKMHTEIGDRPFVCSFCNMGFNLKSNLLWHLRTLHDEPTSCHDEFDGAGPSTIKREP